MPYGYVDASSHDYQAFVEKADNYTNMSPHGIPNGKYRMTNTEAMQTKTLGDSMVMAKQIKDLEDRVSTITAILQQMTEVLRVSTEQIERVCDAVDVPHPVLQLVDDEFLAAAANPETYGREPHADQRQSSIQPDARA